jgi:hypothetical protein
VVIEDSSRKGFATRSYKKVYKDYRRVSEEVLENKKVPVNRRRFVRRYFRLIQPRH